MGKFKTFITEAIGLDAVKKAIGNKPIWDYKNDLTEEFGSDYRKTIGTFELDDSILDEHPLYNKLEDEFVKLGYILTKEGYIKGYVSKNKQQFKIGKILLRMYDKSGLNKFKNLADAFRDDPIRRTNMKPYLIVVSKHPYDVLGASTDRNWTSCVNLGGGIVYSKNTGMKKDMNADRLINSLHEPFMVAYLVDPDDSNAQGKVMIQRPLSRILIYPFKSEDGEEYNWSIGEVYGANNKIFEDTVRNWVINLNEKFKENEIHVPIPEVYYDSFDEELVNSYYTPDEMFDQVKDNLTGKGIDLGSLVLDDNMYSIYDLTLNQFISNEIMNHPLVKDKVFFDNHFQPIIHDLLMQIFYRVYKDMEDMDIYRIYDNGSIQMARIPLKGVPESMNVEEDEILFDYGPYGYIYVILSELRQMNNTYKYTSGMAGDNLETFFTDLERMVGDQLIEQDIEPDIENWQEVDSSMFHDMALELQSNFNL